MAQRYKLITTTTAEATSIEYPNQLVTANLIFKQVTTTRMAVRNSADDGYEGMQLRFLVMDEDITFSASAKSINASNSDDHVLYLKARDNTSGLVEVARLQGAADPYLQATLPLVFLPIATASLPATPVEGMVTYDDTLKKLVVYTGAAWETVTSAAP